jgi:hypothetical protein
MILYIEKAKDSTKKLLEMEKSIKFQDTKLTYKSPLHLYTLTNYPEKKTIQFIIAAKTKIVKNKFNQGGKKFAYCQ